MHTKLFRNARFLIVDDEPQNINVLTQMLQQWSALNIVSTTDPCEVVSLFTATSPDLVLLDLMMPVMDGFEVLEALKPLISAEDFVPILVLTADPSDHTKRRALGKGAADFLTKPFDAIELSLRMDNLLSRRLLHKNAQDQNRILDHQVQERTLQLAQAEIDTAQCLATAGEYRDDDTGQHTQRVGHIAAELGALLGMSEKDVALLRRAAALHDVGKIGIPDSILLKPGKLTDEEFATMKTHTSIGSAILAMHHTELLRLAAEIALTHHERWDGRGYPGKLLGQEIPLSGRIVAVADVFDALTHKRPYKEAWPVEQAAAEIRMQSGSQFDPEVIAAFSGLA